MADINTLDEFDFHRTLARTSGTSIVLFSYSGCSSCRRWKILLREYLDGGANVAVFEVDAQRDQGLTRNFSVFHLPALFLYHDGKYHGALQCEARLDALDRTITTTLSMPAEDPP